MECSAFPLEKYRNCQHYYIIYDTYKIYENMNWNWTEKERKRRNSYAGMKMRKSIFLGIKFSQQFSLELHTHTPEQSFTHSSQLIR